MTDEHEECSHEDPRLAEILKVIKHDISKDQMEYLQNKLREKKDE